MAMIREIFAGRPYLQRFAGVVFWSDGAPNLRLADLVDAYASWFANNARVNGTGIKYKFIDFVPPPKATITITAFTLKCVGSIRHKENWEVLRVDKRRKI